MSHFGDNTPHRDMLESVEGLQQRFGLTDEEVVVILLKVASAIIDPVDLKSDELRSRKPAEEKCAAIYHWVLAEKGDEVCGVCGSPLLR